jgi:hypothetical protein
MNAALPPRPKLGRRDLWAAVATALLPAYSLAMHAGCAPPTEVVMSVLAIVGYRVHTEWKRPSGMSAGGPDA